MMQYRKKPVVIEAILYQAELGNNRIMNWLALHGANIKDWTFHDGEITMPTIEGKMTAKDGDYIIKGIKGEFCPCKPDIFAATYEPVDQPKQEQVCKFSRWGTLDGDLLYQPTCVNIVIQKVGAYCPFCGRRIEVVNG